MRDTHLILIEGLPGSGKTGTAQRVAEALAAAGQTCQCFYEWSEDNPIQIGDFDHLVTFIAEAPSRQDELVEQWRRMAGQRAGWVGVTILEGRLWQMTSMLMYAAGASVEDVAAYHRRVVEAVAGLKPVLIYLAASDVQAALQRTIRQKNREWERDGVADTWGERIFSILNSQAWFKRHSLDGPQEMYRFFAEWKEIAEGLYADLPFPRIKIEDPYRDWTKAGEEMRVFLDL